MKTNNNFVVSRDRSLLPKFHQNAVHKSEVIYAAVATNLMGVHYVISKHISNTWLWDRVRVSGGAYGGYCHFNSHSGVFSFLSYRDPNLLKTLNIYDGTGDFLRGLDVDKDTLTKAILGTIGDVDSYQIPDAKGYSSASFSTGEKRASENGPDLSTFIGDLAPDVSDAVLLETFAGRYPSVKGAKVVIDSNTGRSKGYGFVRFGDENELSRAMTEMNGAFCSSRQMRVGIATPKRAAAYGQQNGSQALTLAGGHGGNGSMANGSLSDGESNNSTIFVGGLDA